MSSPVGTTEVPQDNVLRFFSRPFGTTRVLLAVPSTACWAKFSRPFGTLPDAKTEFSRRL